MGIKLGKKAWWLYTLFTIGVLLVIGGICWLVLSTDNPQLAKSEVIAIVKHDLTELGISGHQIESVDSVYDVNYIGDGRWQGRANVSYSYLVESSISGNQFNSSFVENPINSSSTSEGLRPPSWYTPTTTPPETQQPDIIITSIYSATGTRIETKIESSSIVWIYYESLGIVEILN